LRSCAESPCTQVLNERLSVEPEIDAQIVHTGQHYDEGMSEVFFRQLGLPWPHISLTVGSAPNGAQTGRVLERFEAASIDRPADGHASDRIVHVLRAAIVPRSEALLVAGR